MTYVYAYLLNVCRSCFLSKIIHTLYYSNAQHNDLKSFNLEVLTW